MKKNSNLDILLNFSFCFHCKERHWSFGIYSVCPLKMDLMGMCEKVHKIWRELQELHNSIVRLQGKNYLLSHNLLLFQDTDFFFSFKRKLVSKVRGGRLLDSMCVFIFRLIVLLNQKTRYLISAPRLDEVLWNILAALSRMSVDYLFRLY